MKLPDQLLLEASQLFRERNPAYGDAYRQAGKVLAALFPNGINIETPEGWSQVAVLIHIINKLLRIAAAGESGADTDDSCRDLTVYSAMLHSLLVEDSPHGSDSQR